MIQKLLITIYLGLFMAPCFSQSPQSGFAERDPRYRLQSGDVIEVTYRYTPEFNQTVSVQPDGYVSLSISGPVKLGGLTVDAATAALVKHSSARLRDPDITVSLKEYTKPFFVVAGEVGAPGRFELRGSVSALQAVAMAGGLKNSAKHSEAILYRKIDDETAETKLVNLKQIATMHGMGEDIALRAGDLLFVPQNRISRIERFVRWTSVGVFWNPAVR